MDKLKLAVIADLHYYSPSLGTTGRAYEIRSATDQKCLAESGALTDAAFESIALSDCDAVLIAGDLSNDGEVVSHQEVKVKIDKLAQSKPVFVVYATHDWCCSEDAARYEGDQVIHEGVPTMTPPQLREFYYEYGPRDAISEYICEIGASSYCVKLKDGYRLLGINDDKNGKGKAGYSEAHLQWILKQIADAKAAGDTIIAMHHHLIMPGFSELVNGGMLIGDWQEMAETLADAGLEFLFVGHSHTQRTSCYTSKQGNRLWQINLGSSSGWPAPYTFFTIDDREAQIDVNYTTRFFYNGQVLGSDFVRAHTLGVVKNIIENADKGRDALAAQLKGYGLELDKIKVPYPIIRSLAKHVKNDSIKQAAAKVNFLTFGKGIDKKAAAELHNVKLVDLVYELFLNFFDGSLHPHAPNSAVYKVVTDAASLPRRIAAKLPVKALKKEKIQKLFADVEKTAKETLYPAVNNQHAVIARRK